MNILISLVTNLFLWSRRSMGFRVNTKRNDIIKLNLGCGMAVCKGWINIDASFNAVIASFPIFIHKLTYKMSGSNQYYTFDEYHKLLKENEFFMADISIEIPTKNDSVDYIYSSHFLEHLNPKQADNLIAESYRVLKKNGLIRIVVPDLDYAIKLLVDGKKRQSLDSYFFNPGSNFSRHKYMYDFILLEELLHSYGFKNIERKGHRNGKCPDIEILDNRPEDSLYVEAVK